MHALVLLLLRASTGLLLVIWGLPRVVKPEVGQHLSDTYYMGMFSGQWLHQTMGAAEVLLGLLVIVGLFRKYVYPLQAVVLGFGLFIILPYIVDPYGAWLMEEGQILFFPSTTVFFATLVMLLFKEHDRYALDEKFSR